MLSLYEKQVRDLFKINVMLLTRLEEEPNMKTTVWIDNTEPYFVWS